MSGIKVFAPASIGNVAVGFDTLGLCIDAPGDEVIARISSQKGVRITAIHGAKGRLPLEAEKNTAGVAALRFLEFLGETRGVELEIHKKMPLGSGLGSSAASAVAATLAVHELFKTGLSRRELLPFAAAGEAVASGGIHLDNVAPSLIGGLILVRDNATFDVHRILTPRGLFATVVHPHLEILTKDARAILSKTVDLTAHVQQSANLGAFILGCMNQDWPLMERSLRDDVIEPQRARLIPGFYEVKSAALEAGAFGCSISGAGPSIFCLSKSSIIAERAGEAMQKAFAERKIGSEIYVSAVNHEGARVV